MPKQNTVIAVALGQLLSLCITGTSSASSALWRHYSISIPFTQNLCNYVLLTIVYTFISYTRHRDLGPKNKISWQFFGFSFADVQANVLAVLAFKNTSVLSALVLSSWTIPCIMLLSTYFSLAKYSKFHIQCACFCLVGLALLIWGDTMGNDASTVNHNWIGDLVCLSGATLYAISNVTEEYLVKHHTSTEFLKKAGCWGSLLCGIQAFYFEFDRVIQIHWSWPVLSLITTYVLCLFCMYSLVPTVYRMMGATFLSMSLITSNFYSLVVGLLFLDAKMPPFYPVAYAIVIASVTAYSLTPSPSSNEEKPHQPYDEERSPLIVHTIV